MTNKRKAIINTDKAKTAQAALDYLMSWGWVLIIIVLVLVILFSLGVFRVPSAPTIISGFQGITMQAAEANSTMMVVKITNNYNQFVNVTGITVNINGNTYTTYYCLNSIVSTGQSTLCRVPVSIPTSSYLSKIQISFTPYKSSIYEVSNGTVSSTLVSGAIPINNQLTYFVEKGLPYGSTFTVNYNTSNNSIVVSSINDNVSFNLPFGNYYFSVPTVNFQSCTSKPTPSSGYHSTGVEEIIAFTSNCTTTFTETGLPSNQQWQVTYNGTTASNATGSAINIKTNNISNSQVYYTAIAKSGNLACVSYKTPSIRLGGNYTFSAWNCTTTFSETGLPSNQQWHVSNYQGSSSSTVSTDSKASIYQINITNVSSYSASASDNIIDCYSNPDITAEQGSSGNTFTIWTCITSFSETGLPSNQYWQVTYNGTTTRSSTGSIIPITTNNVKNAAVSYTATAKSDSISCVSYVTPSVYLGNSYTFSAWNCITTFSTSLPSAYNSYDWSITYTGVHSSYTAVTNSIPITTTDISTISAEPITQGNIENLDCNYNATSVGYTEGSSYNINANYWNCITTFTESGLNSGTNWAVIIGSNEPTGSSTSLSINSLPENYSVYIPGDLITSSGQKYIQSNSPSSILAGAGSNINYAQQLPTAVPSGVAFYVPITISNAGDSQAIPKGFQQRVTFNANNYGEFESQNLQNVLFFNSTGQIIPSWLELGNSSYSDTTYWLKLPFPIQPYSSPTIYMGFGPTNTNFFSMYSGKVGEAPQLSPTYGEYDNGANVFNLLYLNGNSNTASGTDPTYDPFSVISYSTSNGSGSCPVTSASNIPYPGSQTSSGDVSAIYNSNSGACLYNAPNGYVVTIYTKAMPNQPVIVESNFNIKNALGSDNGVVGLTNYSYVPPQNSTTYIPSSPPLWGIGTQSGGVNVENCSTSNCYLEYQDYAADDYFADAGAQYGTYSYGNKKQGKANGNWNYAELKYYGVSTYYSYVGSLPEYIDNGSGYSSTENTGFSFSGKYLYFATLSWTSESGHYAYKTYFNWIFARDLSPTDSMPSISFGGITPVGYAEITTNTNQNYVFAVTWAGGNANIYLAAGYPGSISYDLTNTLTGASISSSSTTNCMVTNVSNLNLPARIYSVSGGTGGGEGFCSSPNAAILFDPNDAIFEVS